VYVKDSASREVMAPARFTGRSSERGIALRFFDREGRSSLAAATFPAGDEMARDLRGGEPPSGASRRLAIALARRAAEAAAFASPSAPRRMPGTWSADGRGLGLFDPDIEKPPEDLLETAEEIRSRASEQGRTFEAHVHLIATTSSVHLANSAGFSGSYRQTLARLDLTLEALEGGRSAAARVVRTARSLRGLAADSAAAEGLALMEEGLAPEIPPSGIHEIILAPRAAAELVAAISAWFTAGIRAQPGDSRPLAPSRGERIGAAPLTILDDGRLPGGVASSPFDGEGVPTRRTVAVERGIVREILRDLDSETEGEESTGNGVRASFREAPSLRPTNFFIKPGAASPSDLLASIRQGIRISSLARIPPLRGPDTAFAVPFSGRWIEGGRLGAPLGGGYLAGTAREILAEVESVAGDLAFFHRSGSFGAPSLLIRRAPIRSS
jgi:PmbA protein